MSFCWVGRTSWPGQTTVARQCRDAFFSCFLWHNLSEHKQAVFYCDVSTLRKHNKNFSMLIVIFIVVFQEFSDNTMRNDPCSLIKNIIKCFPAPFSWESHFHVSSKRLISRGKVLGGCKRLRLSADALLCHPWLLGHFGIHDQNFTSCIGKLLVFVYTDFSALFLGFCLLFGNLFLCVCIFVGFFCLFLFFHSWHYGSFLSL